MKVKITKTIKHIDGSISFGENLYNFSTIKEARERLQSIKRLCRYPVEKEGLNFFTANRHGCIYQFKIERN